MAFPARRRPSQFNVICANSQLKVGFWFWVGFRFVFLCARRARWICVEVWIIWVWVGFWVGFLSACRTRWIVADPDSSVELQAILTHFHVNVPLEVTLKKSAAVVIILVQTARGEAVIVDRTFVTWVRDWYRGKSGVWAGFGFGYWFGFGDGVRAGVARWWVGADPEFSAELQDTWTFYLVSFPFEVTLKISAAFVIILVATFRRVAAPIVGTFEFLC